MHRFKTTALLTGTALLLAPLALAVATGTTLGTTITNDATVTFSAGGTSQSVTTTDATTTSSRRLHIASFRDRDFEEPRATRQGMFVTARIKFDGETLAGLFG